MNKIIAVPMGDPAGVGPEIIVKALNSKKIYDACSPIIIGNKAVIEEALKLTNLTLSLNVITDVNDGIYKHGTIDLISIDNVDMDLLEYGKVQAQCGIAAYEYIELSVNLAMNNKVLALATTPINKEALKAGNIPFIGHTEMLEELTNTKDPLTMFEVMNMKVFFLTRHASLHNAIKLITKERVHDYLVRCDKALKRLGVENRTIAVAGLNPHSGENGLFGMEEVNEIVPGIEAAIKDGIKAVGPVPADSVFHHALNGVYDAVLSLYHDQGHIATKMVDFDRTIAITNGLPFLRTSVDHGTAFDIAWKGIASSISMEESIMLAAKYSLDFNKNRSVGE